MKQIVQYVELSKEEWSTVDLGDQRLTDRAVKIGAKFLQNPFVSPPKMLKSPKDLKAFYRFMDSDKVSHTTLIHPHTEKAKKVISQQSVILSIQDSTTLTFKRNYEIEGLYDVGNIPGLVIHNTISVIPHNNYGIISGLLHQIINRRIPKEKRAKGNTEIKLWTESIKAVGNPSEKTTIIDVMDRGADAAEVMNCSLENQHEFILRAKYDRYVKDDEHKYLFEYAKSLQVMGQKTLKVQASNGRKKRKAKLNIAYSKITLKSPKNQQQFSPVNCNIIHVYEKDTPDSQEPLEWFLLTSLEVNTFEDAKKVIRYYTYRWIIEEFHKCLKTGFRIEQTQMKELQRIESLLGMISVSSVKLLQMRDLAKRNPNEDALKYVSGEDIKIVRAYYKTNETTQMKIGTFLRYIAQMGGFLNRKSDGNPGWQSIWEGWKFFLTLKEGVKLSKEVTYG